MNIPGKGEVLYYFSSAGKGELFCKEEIWTACRLLAIDRYYVRMIQDVYQAFTRL